MLGICCLGVILVCANFGQTTKTGKCPPPPDINVCYKTCLQDEHCSGIQKCCRTACRGTFCVDPVTLVAAEINEKPGYCPKPQGPWVCSSRCSLDSDCRGTKKCCKNRCGAMACTKPIAVDPYF